MPQDFTAAQVLTAAQMDTLSAAVDGYATTATAAGTTTLTFASMYQQYFTGSTTQTVVMPVASTCYVGWKIRIVNNSSGVVTVQSSGANTIYAVPAGGDVLFTCILASGTTAASWDFKDYKAAITAGLVGVGLTKSAVQSIANTTYTALSWDGEGWDTDAYHDNATNNSRVTIPSGKTGKYLVTGLIQFDSSPSGAIRIVNIYKNGVATGDIYLATNSGGITSMFANRVMSLVATDYIEIFAYQNSGGALDIKGTTTFGTSLQVTYLGA